MKTWKRNGVALSIDRQADGWWSAALRDVDGEVRDSAICERAFPLLRSLARGFRRLARGAATAALVMVVAFGCGTTREAPLPATTRCLNEVAWNGYAWTSLPEQWVDDSFCRPISKRDPSWRCAATDTRDAAGHGEVSYRWASCAVTARENK